MLEFSDPLSTPRMTLRLYEMGDLASLHDMFSREDVCRYLIWEPMDVDRARAKLMQRVQQTQIEADGDAILLAAIDAETAG